jgi:predicted 3-demethylubiquinone-9 3-methyltransferase (glyoxalase superfamily)
VDDQLRGEGLRGMTDLSAPSTIRPCLWFDDAAEQASSFYVSLFGGGSILHVGRYGEQMPRPAGSVMIVEFAVGGQVFQALNGGPQFRPNPSISFFVQVRDEAEVRRLYAGLEAGGRALMPLGTYAWSTCYAWVEDRFGVTWQIMTGDFEAGAPRIVPCLMFANAQQGRAGEAIDRYVATFTNAREIRREHYAAGEAPTHLVKHARFELEGQELAAMDSPIPHAFDFSEGLSLSVRAADQAAVDRLWSSLTSNGGESGPCGWLKDPFGVSWQIVPEALVTLQSSGNAIAAGRMFRAMMAMGKLDIAALEAAFRGE